MDESVVGEYTWRYKYSSAVAIRYNKSNRELVGTFVSDHDVEWRLVNNETAIVVDEFNGSFRLEYGDWIVGDYHGNLHRYENDHFRECLLPRDGDSTRAQLDEIRSAVSAIRNGRDTTQLMAEVEAKVSEIDRLTHELSEEERQHVESVKLLREAKKRADVLESRLLLTEARLRDAEARVVLKEGELSGRTQERDTAVGDFVAAQNQIVRLEKQWRRLRADNDKLSNTLSEMRISLRHALTESEK